MSGLLPYFIELSLEFKRTKVSVHTVHKLFDLIYNLHRKERSFEENYILAECYHLLGYRNKAEKILESVISTAGKKENEKALKLILKLRKGNAAITIREKQYRDLREASEPKKQIPLSFDDFTVIREDGIYRIAFSTRITRLVIFNKNVQTGDIDIFSKIQPDEFIILQLIYHFEWLSELEKELTAFYKTADTDYKPEKTDPDWFNGLDIWNVLVEIDSQEIIHTELLVQDYYNHDFGFHLSLQDQTITDLQYDPVL